MSDFSSIGSGMNGTGSVGPINRIAPLASLSGVNRLTGTVEPLEVVIAGPDADRVELSDRARFLDMLRQLPEIRQDRIDRVKLAIDSGEYETDDKVEAAIEQWAREELS